MIDAIKISTPIGPLWLSATQNGIREIKFKAKVEDIEQGDSKNPHLVECVRQLTAYFKGELQKFDLQLDWSDASEFYKSVWSYLLSIPFGKTVSYSDIAIELNNPKSVRAVGMANGRNPLPIIVPCHRVIGKSGKLHGFSGGLDIKAELLFLENPQAHPIQQTLF